MELHPPRAPPEPGPEPEPAAPARQASQDALNHPALTGMQPHDITALAAALEIPYRARLEHKAFLERGGRRVNAVRSSGAPHGNRRTDVTGHVLIIRLRDHPHLPVKVIAALLGIDPTTVSHATAIARDLITTHAIPLPPAAQPPPAPIRTLDELREYGARHGITITVPPQPTLPRIPRQPPRTHPKLDLF